MAFDKPGLIVASKFAEQIWSNTSEDKATPSQNAEIVKWWARKDSNLGPLQCECSALPIELRAQKIWYFLFIFSIIKK